MKQTDTVNLIAVLLNNILSSEMFVSREKSQCLLMCIYKLVNTFVGLMIQT